MFPLSKEVKWGTFWVLVLGLFGGLIYFNTYNHSRADSDATEEEDTSAR